MLPLQSVKGQKMIKITGSILKEQGITFAIVVVKSHILNSTHSCTESIQSISPLFPGMPVVLMAQDSRGRAKYHGRSDIVRFLANVSLNRIPWKEYTFS
jgi:hypothetical protein